MPRITAALRETIRLRANGRCEYCRLPDKVTGFRFHVEHIRALKHGGNSDPDNLAWACILCNGHKGSDMAGFDPNTGELTRLYDPRRDRWDDHFEVANGHILGRTPIGRVTVILLRLTDPRLLEMRRALIETDRS